MTTMTNLGRRMKEVEREKRRKGGEGDQDLQDQGPVQDLQSRDQGLDRDLVAEEGDPTTKILTRMTWILLKKILG